MDQRNFHACLWLAPLTMGALLLMGNRALAEGSCVSEKCHVTLLKAANVHPVAESCDGCHESVSTPHPQKGKKTFKLTQEPPDLCNTCHPGIADKKEVHFPVAQGMCTTCHNPHASDQPKLLTQPLKDVCGACHADHLAFKVMHGPVSAGACTACHTPHGSVNARLLIRRETRFLCLQCHVDPFAANVPHGRLGFQARGDCTRCHAAIHGSNFDANFLH